MLKIRAGRRGFKVIISYSQHKIYQSCPLQWKLIYIDKHDVFDPNINLVFGTSLHQILQEYLKVVYNESVRNADQLDLPAMLQDSMIKNYEDDYHKYGKHFCTPDELNRYYLQGCRVLEWFKKHRGDYFPIKGWELAGIETELNVPIRNNIYFKGFLDVVLRDTIGNRLRIIDIKTSDRGWNKYQKRDPLKLSQLILYKMYYAQQFDVPVDNIDVQFIIFKRRLYGDIKFPQKRIQKVKFASGKVKQKQLRESIDGWINSSFTENGEYRTNVDYPAISGKNKRNCKYCVFDSREDLCPQQNRRRL